MSLHFLQKLGALLLLTPGHMGLIGTGPEWGCDIRSVTIIPIPV